MADLITTTRAKYALDSQAITLTADEETTLAALVTAVSRAVERFCRRTFSQSDHDELHDGSGAALLILRHYPVLSVERVAAGPVAVLRVTNTGAANQRAGVAVTPDGLALTRVAAGVTSTDTSVTWVAHPTLADVAAAVSALGNGWSAEAVEGHGGRASADLFAPQGALDAKDRPAEILLHAEGLGDFEIDAERGWLLRAAGSVWVRGRRNYRVRYTAGYATVPEDVQEAAAQWVAELFWQTKANPGLAPVHPPLGVRVLLEPWRRFGV